MNDIDLIIDLQKGAGKGKREGLIQTVITYVRNGKVITRKQWVRSEYAKHAKKNEEEKKEVMVRQAEREKEKKKRELEEMQEKEDKQGDKERKKLERRQLEYSHGGLEHMDEVLKEYYKNLKKKHIQEEQERREIEEKRKVKKRKDEKQEKKKNRSAFGQKEATISENKRQLEIRN